MTYSSRRSKQQLKATAVESALIGIAAEFSQWPDEWEHCCYFSVERPWCHVCDWREREWRFNASVTDLAYWREEMDETFEQWRMHNYWSYPIATTTYTLPTVRGNTRNWTMRENETSYHIRFRAYANEIVDGPRVIIDD